jgi:hypothetical protein
MVSVIVWIASGLVLAAGEQKDTPSPGGKYFKIQVVDRQTGRGVPLVELQTVNSIRYYTDSNGIVAFYEQGLMNRDVFFFVTSHGYEFPKDGFGFRGTRLRTTEGVSEVVKIDRLNIAERLYRITGQGIYRDSVLTGQATTVSEPVLNGQVMGQDSVFTCIYRGRLFWMWGDTARPSYPLGHFAMATAVSDLPGQGGLDPAVGVNLRYYVDEDGFSRPVCRLKEPGLVWLDGLLTAKDKEGRERMVAKFARLKSMEEASERGLVVFNDTTGSFEPVYRTGIDGLPFTDFGHAFGVNVDGQEYYYFAIPFPMAVRMRVKAKWNCVVDPNRYEVLTSLSPGGGRGGDEQRVDVGGGDRPWRWVSYGDLVADEALGRGMINEALRRDKQDVNLYDVGSGKKVSPHGGSVYYNEYRRRWVMIFVQQYGESSFLGEAWYAEADTPVGPWAYARKIATHNKYSFYNPMQHPYFDQDRGRMIYFEGTYTYTFSGSEENATPRYDYNQIMYRLNLDDRRLVLPVPVYEVSDRQGGVNYALRDGVERAGSWNLVESIPFYAIEPSRGGGELIDVYVKEIPANDGAKICLTTEKPTTRAEPLFRVLPAEEAASENSCVASLYEYRDADDGRCVYSTEPVRREGQWNRGEKPLCRVWRAPEGVCLVDGPARPMGTGD